MVNIDIITYATGYDYYIYERFVETLLKTGFGGTLHIIIKPHDRKHIQRILEKHPESKIIYFVDEFSELSKCPQVNRFFTIHHYVVTLDVEPEYLFLCDFRDVLFQKNIEEYPYNPDVDLYGFLEGKRIIDEPNYNTPWIKSLEKIMGEEIYDKISQNHIICCGTTLGKIHAIREYLERMCDILFHYNIHSNLDQGIHNYMLYMGKLPNIRIELLSNSDNLVNTVGFDVHALNDDSEIINREGQVSWVVHQYDRFSLKLLHRLGEKHQVRLQ
jgi:hypothetical protein